MQCSVLKIHKCLSLQDTINEFSKKKRKMPFYAPSRNLEFQLAHIFSIVSLPVFLILAILVGSSSASHYVFIVIFFNDYSMEYH